jgi:predicted Fe-Mo cluster-binding NifX family protein
MLPGYLLLNVRDSYGAKMKIVLTTTQPDLDAELDPRFGRCAYLLIVDPHSLEWQAKPNAAVGAAGGAGVQAAQFISTQQAQAVISGDFGPNAFEALQAAGIEMYQFDNCHTAREAIQRFLADELRQVGTATRAGGHSKGRSRR